MTLVIGTAGHIDHGKTTLLRALTGIDADRLPEEQRRGLTIDVGYAHGSPDGGPDVDFVDVPGHDRLVGNMLVGVGEIDACLLVVAADDGPRAQTWEHVALLDAMGIERGLVAVTKSDLVAPERVTAVGDEMAAVLARSSLAAAPIVAVSAARGDGLDALRQGIAELRDRGDGSRLPDRGVAWLAIDRAFSVRGHGVVVTGSARGARLRVGDSLRGLPGGLTLRVRAIEVHDVAVDEVPDGGRAALNVTGAALGQLRRGLLLVSVEPVAGPLGPVDSERLLVALHRPAALPGRRVDDPWPPDDGTTLRLHIGTDQVDASVARSGRDGVTLPDGSAIAMLRLAAPVATAVGERFVLRRPPPAGLLAGGIILDPSPARGRARRRQTASALERLARAVAAQDTDATVAALLGLRGWLAEVPGPELAPDVRDAVAGAVLEAVEAHHLSRPLEAGMPLSAARAVAATALRRHVAPGRPEAGALVASLMTALVAGDQLVRTGDMIRHPTHRPPARDPRSEEAAARLLAALDVNAPPSLRDAAAAAGCDGQAVRELERDGRIVVVADDLAWSSAAFARLRDEALSLAAAGPVTPARLRDATGTSRKYVMALLEELDRRGILARTPAGHIRGPRA